MSWVVGVKELEQIVKKQEAEKEAAQAAAIAANPKIQDALAHSATVFNDLRFCKFATARDVELAEQRQALAKTDPAAYWKAFWPLRKDWDARADAAVVDSTVAREIEARAKATDTPHPLAEHVYEPTN